LLKTKHIWIIKNKIENYDLIVIEEGANGYARAMSALD